MLTYRKTVMSGAEQPVEVKGWKLYAHPLFFEQVNALREEVKKLKQTQPAEWQNKAATKKLAAIYKLVFQVIPQNPYAHDYRLGKTLGPDYKNWFRAKFFQQYRLFFRYDAQSGIIVYAWVNDENTLRSYGSKKDAYEVFKKMLNRGTPPADWKSLIKESVGITEKNNLN